MKEEKYNIGQLAELTGISRRTIRFYVQSGILQPPKGAGRGHYYTTEHLETLQKIFSLKENRHSLEEIAAIIGCEKPSDVMAMPAPTIWTRIEITPGVEIHVQGGLYPVTPGRVKKLQKYIHQLFGPESNQIKGEEEE